MSDRIFYPNVPEEHVLLQAGESRLWPSLNNPANWTFHAVWLNLEVGALEQTRQKLLSWAKDYFKPNMVFKDTSIKEIIYNNNQRTLIFYYHFRESEESWKEI